MNQTDVNKLYKCIATDFKLVTRKTGLWEMEYCNQILHDIKVLLDYEYLQKIDLVLEKPKGMTFKVKQFVIGEINRSADDRPGDNNWDENDGEYLTVVLHYTSHYNSISKEEKQRFQKHNLEIGWSSSSIDTKFPNLSKSQSKKYTSNILGVDRYEFE